MTLGWGCGPKPRITAPISIEPTLIVSNVLELSVVYRHQGYSAGEMAEALRRLGTKYPTERIWGAIAGIISMLLT